MGLPETMNLTETEVAFEGPEGPFYVIRFVPSFIQDRDPGDETEAE